MNNKKRISTIWLDFLNYIFMPFNILTITLTAIKQFGLNHIIISILYIVALIIYFVCFYKVHKRDKYGYYLLYLYIILSLFMNIIEIINRYKVNNIMHAIIMFIVGIILWIIPNYVYLRKRKNIFCKRQLLNIKKCPGCKRIIPITMPCCGRCDYKGE